MRAEEKLPKIRDADLNSGDQHQDGESVLCTGHWKGEALSCSL